jgi:hypothetical protein
MKGFLVVLLGLLNLALAVMGLLLVVPDVQKAGRSASGYWQGASELSASTSVNMSVVFLGEFLNGEPSDTYFEFREYSFTDKRITDYFNAFYAYYFEVMNLNNAARYSESPQPEEPADIPLPSEYLFAGYTDLRSVKDYKNMTEYQRTLFEAAVPLKTFAAWYTARTVFGYNKHMELSRPEDLAMMARARSFIEFFAGKGLPFEYLSRVMALELELMYRQSRTTSFWDTNQRWDAEGLKRVYTRIAEYRERFGQEFASSQTGAVGWILAMEALAAHEVPNTGLFATREQKEALDRERKLLGSVPGLVLRSLE